MLGLLLALAGTAPDPIDRFVRSFLEAQRIPSAAIAVVQRGRVSKLAGYGQASLELPAPAGPHTVYEIGSITKQFTAEVVMLLAAEGRLELDAPLARYLPELPDSWRDIRIRHLLTHTSGLPDWEEPGWLDFSREYTPAEFIRLVGAHPLDFAPGDQWAYSNSAYPLLGMLIERVTGQPFAQVVTERIFRPAGMRETRFRRAGEVVANRAAGYVDSAGTLRNGMPLRPALLAPNGGILSTAADLARWSLALLRGRLVPRPVFEAMATPVRLNDGTTFNAGIGWFVDHVRGHRVLIHNGVTAAGYSSVIYLYPEDGLFVAVLLNIDRGAAVNRLATGIAGLALPAVAR
jgi:CubicO group peptidase (beta-lactamase class C family)